MLWFLALGHYYRRHLYAESRSFLPLFCLDLFLLTVWSFPWVLSLGSQEGLCSKGLICIFFPLLLSAIRNFKPTSPSHPPLFPHFLPNQRLMQMLMSVIFPCDSSLMEKSAFWAVGPQFHALSPTAKATQLLPQSAYVTTTRIYKDIYLPMPHEER